MGVYSALIGIEQGIRRTRPAVGSALQISEPFPKSRVSAGEFDFALHVGVQALQFGPLPRDVGAILGHRHFHFARLALKAFFVLAQPLFEVAAIVKGKLPLCVGMPEIKPAEESVKPAGSAPVVTLNVTVPAPPDCVMVVAG